MRRYLPFISAVLLMTVILPVTKGVGDGPAPTRSGEGVLFVSPSGSTWSSVQEAVDNATDGDIIRVAPGEYSEGFVIIKDGITISGNSSEGEVNITWPSEHAVGVISGDRIELSGLNLIGSQTHLYLLMISNSHTVNITDCRLETDVSDGVYVRDCFNVSMKNITLMTRYHYPMTISDVDNMDVEVFHFEMKDTLIGINLSAGCDDIEFGHGKMSMNDESSVLFKGTDGMDLVTRDLNVSYGRYFLQMDTGDVDCIDTEFDAEDVNITSGDVTDRMDVYFTKDVLTTYHSRPSIMHPEGQIFPALVVVLDLDTDEDDILTTSYYGGEDPVSDMNGSFGDPIWFRARNYTGGGFPPTIHSGSADAYWPDAEINGNLAMDDVDLSNNDPILIEFNNTYHTNGTVHGQFIHSGGPLNGTPVVNASLKLVIPFDPDQLVVNRSVQENITYPVTGHIRFTSTDVNGSYSFDQVPFGHGLYLEVIDSDDSLVNENGNASGYITDSWEFHHIIQESPDSPMSEVWYYYNTTGTYPDTELNLELDYYEYIPPDIGSISGVVRFGTKGPFANEVAPNTTVYLYNRTGDIVAETITDTDGNYSFENIPFEEGYELRAMPSEDVLGVNNNRSGYLFWDGSAFDHTNDTRINISLKYYKHIQDAEKHPKVAIIDKDNEPLEGVRITLYLNGEKIDTGYTNEVGVAQFDRIDGMEFPEGAHFKAELDGYQTIEWNDGEGIPKMAEEEPPEDDLVLIWVLIGMIVAVLVIGTILITRKKKPLPEE